MGGVLTWMRQRWLILTLILGVAGIVGGAKLVGAGRDSDVRTEERQVKPKEKNTAIDAALEQARKQALEEQEKARKAVEKVVTLEEQVQALSRERSRAASDQQAERKAFADQLAALDQKLTTKQEQNAKAVDQTQKLLQQAVQQLAQQPKQAPASGQKKPQPAGPRTAPALQGLRLYVMGKETKPGEKPLGRPRVNHADIPYLPAGSFADGTLVFGALTSWHEKSPAPLLFAVRGEFTGPWHLQGPERAPLQTAIQIQGCFVPAHGAGHLGKGRILARLTLLSCVFPSGETMEVPIDGYVVDVDNIQGMVATIQHHEGRAAAIAFFTGLIEEAANVFSAARQKVVVANISGVQPGQGAQHTLQKFADYYLEQMQELAPTLHAEAGKRVRLVLRQGVALEGYPTQVLVSQGEKLWATY